MSYVPPVRAQNNRGRQNYFFGCAFAFMFLIVNSSHSSHRPYAVHNTSSTFKDTGHMGRLQEGRQCSVIVWVKHWRVVPMKHVRVAKICKPDLTSDICKAQTTLGTKIKFLFLYTKEQRHMNESLEKSTQYVSNKSRALFSPKWVLKN